MRVVIKIMEDLAEDHLRELRLYNFKIRRVVNYKTKVVTLLATQDTELDRVSIPDILKGRQYQVRFYAVEEGGKSFSNQRATIVCGKNGEKVSALFPVKNPTPCGVHAIFCYSDINTVKITNEEVLIERTQIKVVDNTDIVITKNVVFEGKVDEIPYKMSKFGPAIEAAVKKSKTDHCTGVFYSSNIR